jgi:hypothetical protein
MNRLSIALMTSIALSGLMIAKNGKAEDTTPQLREQQLGVAEPSKRTDDDLASKSVGGASSILSKFDSLNRHFQLMDLPDSERLMQESLKKLQQNPRTFDDLASLYKLLSDANPDDRQSLGEARWRTLYVMGELRNRQAEGFLFEIATKSLPSPEEGEVNYKTEFRLRARAIEGLEKLKDVKQLQKIYESGGIVASLAAASLFELGQPPRGVTKVVLGLGDPKDFNPPKGSAGGRLTPELKPLQSDNELSISPKWPVQK